MQSSLYILGSGPTIICFLTFKLAGLNTCSIGLNNTIAWKAKLKVLCPSFESFPHITIQRSCCYLWQIFEYLSKKSSKNCETMTRPIRQDWFGYLLSTMNFLADEKKVIKTRFDIFLRKSNLKIYYLYVGYDV